MNKKKGKYCRGKESFQQKLITIYYIILNYSKLFLFLLLKICINDEQQQQKLNNRQCTTVSIQAKP